MFKICIFLFSLIFSNDDSKWFFKADGELGQIIKDDEQIRKFVKNVYINRDTLSLFTDLALQYTNKKELHLIGNIKMISGIDTLTCDSMIFWMDKDSIFAAGQIKLKQQNRILTSNQINYWKTNGYRKASFNADGDVKIIGDNELILANQIAYDDSTQKMNLISKTSISSKNRSLNGNNMLIQYADSLLDSISITGNAYATNSVFAFKSKKQQLKNYKDYMQSKKMNAYFNNGDLSTLLMSGMASSTFHVIDDTLFIGQNDASGDTMIVLFANEKLDAIKVYGGARGKFIPEPVNSSVDSIVVYESDKFEYYIDAQESFLYDNAMVKYQETTLKSAYVRVDWDKSLLEASSDSVQFPTVITPAEEPMVGENLTFNLKTRHGIINKGKTEFNDAFFHGQKIYRDEPNTFHVHKSIYTSCDLDDPHFYFSSNRMKMIPGDRVIAKPLILHIYDIPIIGVPFAVFPSKGGGRRSGWIMPTFGISEARGTYFRHLGYFWAPNDYYDFKSVLSFYDEHGLDFASTINYKKRYSFDGKITSTFYRKLYDTNEIFSLFGTESTQNWDFKWRHNHKIDPTQNINLNYNYVSSSNFYEDTGYDLDTRLKQQINSSLNYSKNWVNTKNSLSINLSEKYNLLEKNRAPKSNNDIVFYKSRSIPNISFRHGQTSIFGAGDRWFNSIYWSLTSNLSGMQKIGQIAQSDSTWANTDTSSYKKGVKHNISLSAPQKLFDWLTFNPKISLQENWILDYREPIYDETGTVFLNSSNYSNKEGFKRRMTGSLSISTNTKIYGIFPFPIGNIQAVRHVITPSLTYTYKPDFTDNFWGFDFNYVYKDVDNNIFDPFSGSSAGSTPKIKQQNLGIRIQNLFQMKYLADDGEYEKFDLLSWNINSNYNMAKDSLKWSTIRSSIQTTIPNGIKIDVSASHDLYDENESGQNINSFKNQLYGIPTPYLTKMEASTTLKISGKRLAGFEFEKTKTDTTGFDDENLLDNNEDHIEPRMGKDNLWQATFSIRYNKNKKREFDYESSAYNSIWEDNFWVNTNLKIKLSKNWKLTYNARFDILKKEMLSQSFHIYRPLHCWEFSFKWWPSGGSQGFFLNINVKNPDLKDIKLESRGGKKRFFGI